MKRSLQETEINRRQALRAGLSSLAAVMAATGVDLGKAFAATPVNFAVSGPYTRSTVAEVARALAKTPFQPATNPLPEILDQLSYDQYRDIRFRPEAAVWANTGLPFQMQLFHRGFYYKDAVEVALVADGQATHFAYDPALFSYGPLVPQPVPTDDIGFSGLRLHGMLNRPDYFDEVIVFQGASYFRSLGKGQTYGLSARALALKTAAPEGEEFPLFRAFWVETPAAGSETCVISALLDSPSTTGAYRFTLRPGDTTLLDVEAQLFPRVDLDRVGMAPGTSMFFFSANGREGVDDFRPEVHDSDGLLMVTGRGERIWRPLANPGELQISAFVDQSPRGFGLIQRNRNFDDYQDLEAGYERRPSLWVEPVGDWGGGAVTLVEIPTDSEVHDNIVAFWAPKEKIAAGTEFSFAYRLAWGGDPAMALGSAFVRATRSGRAPGDAASTKRLFVIDFAFAGGIDRATLGAPKATVTASKGAINNVVINENPTLGGLRISFELDPQNEALIELRAILTFEKGAPAETWVYRWTS